MSDFKETCVSYTSPDEVLSFSSSEKKWINKVIKLKEQRPNDVRIIKLPEDNDGMIYAMLPKSWLKISPPRQVNFTDEQRAAMADRLAAARDKRGEDK